MIQAFISNNTEPYFVAPQVSSNKIIYLCVQLIKFDLFYFLIYLVLFHFCFINFVRTYKIHQ